MNSEAFRPVGNQEILKALSSLDKKASQWHLRPILELLTRRKTKLTEEEIAGTRIPVKILVNMLEDSEESTRKLAFLILAILSFCCEESLSIFDDFGLVPTNGKVLLTPSRQFMTQNVIGRQYKSQFAHEILKELLLYLRSLSFEPKDSKGGNSKELIAWGIDFKNAENLKAKVIKTIAFNDLAEIHQSDDLKQVPDPLDHVVGCFIGVSSARSSISMPAAQNEKMGLLEKVQAEKGFSNKKAKDSNRSTCENDSGFLFNEFQTGYSFQKAIEIAQRNHNGIKMQKNRESAKEYNGVNGRSGTKGENGGIVKEKKDDLKSKETGGNSKRSQDGHLGEMNAGQSVGKQQKPSEEEAHKKRKQFKEFGDKREITNGDVLGGHQAKSGAEWASSFALDFIEKPNRKTLNSNEKGVSKENSK